MPLNDHNANLNEKEEKFNRTKNANLEKHPLGDRPFSANVPALSLCSTIGPQDRSDPIVFQLKKFWKNSKKLWKIEKKVTFRLHNLYGDRRDIQTVSGKFEHKRFVEYWRCTFSSNFRFLCFIRFCTKQTASDFGVRIWMRMKTLV